MGIDRRRWVAMALITPALLFFLVLTVYPLLRSLILSFFYTDYGFTGAKFVGLENYIELFSNSFFRRATWNTVFFTFMATMSEVALGLGLAVLVNRRFPGRGFVVPALVAPYVLSNIVAAAVWRAWFHYDFGFLNNLLRAGGLSPVAWLFDPDLALYSVVLVDLWQTAPLPFLILLAGLQGISPEIYEAASIDGASGRQVLWRIVLPLIRPHLLLAALLRSIDSFKIFGKIYALTGGGPGNATETLSLYVYRLGFRFSDIGLASAAAMFMMVIAGCLAAIYAYHIMKGSDSHV